MVGNLNQNQQQQQNSVWTKIIYFLKFFMDFFINVLNILPVQKYKSRIVNRTTKWYKWNKMNIQIKRLRIQSAIFFKYFSWLANLEFGVHNHCKLCTDIFSQKHLKKTFWGSKDIYVPSLLPFKFIQKLLVPNIHPVFFVFSQ